MRRRKAWPKAGAENAARAARSSRGLALRFSGMEEEEIDYCGRPRRRRAGDHYGSDDDRDVDLVAKYGT